MTPAAALTTKLEFVPIPGTHRLFLFGARRGGFGLAGVLAGPELYSTPLRIPGGTQGWRNGSSDMTTMKEPGDEAGTVDEAAELSAETAIDGTSAEPASAEPQGESLHEAPSSDFAHWLTGSLRPSASKSVPPPAAPAEDAPLATPETLAPQVMNSEELDEEDLAVLPMGARRSGSRLWLGKVTVAAMGAAVAVLMFGYHWWQDAPEPGSDDSLPTVAATPADTEGQPAVAHGSTPLPSEDEKAEPDDASTKTRLGRWIPPVALEEGEQNDTARGPRGPSVARFPDLPAAVWSYLRHAEREKTQSNTESGAAESAPAQSE